MKLLFRTLCSAFVVSMIISASIVNSNLVSAHEYKTDGSIEGLLHINPNDNPKSGALTSYRLTFSDSTNRFSTSDCNCTVLIQENGKTISSEALKPISTSTTLNDVTFPNPDVYTVRVNGQPKQPNSFQSFTLTYTVRVEAGTSNANQQSLSPLLMICLVSLIGIALIGAFISNQYNNHKVKRSS